MPDNLKNAAIGIFMLIALALSICLLLFLHPQVGDAGKTLRVLFTNIDKVEVGTRVTFAGRPVGEVIAIREVAGDRHAGRKGSEPIYAYELTLALDSKVNVYDSDEISVRTSGLMGERSIAITPRSSANGQSKLLENNALVQASTTGSVEDAMVNLQKVAKKAEQTMDEVIDLINSNQNDIQLTLKGLQNASLQAESLLRKCNETNLVHSLDETIEETGHFMKSGRTTLDAIEQEKLIRNMSEALKNINETAKTLNKPQQINAIFQNLNETSRNLRTVTNRLVASWGKIESSVDNFSNAMQDVKSLSGQAKETMLQTHKIVSKVANGQGFLGKLINSDELYLKTTVIMNKLDTLMNDVNNYGVLFHLDKSWQRKRRVRLQDENKLKNPAQFKHKLQEELNQVTDSVSRLELALDQTGDKQSSTDALEIKDPKTRQEFMQALADVLKQVQSLEDSLKTFTNSVTQEETQ